MDCPFTVGQRVVCVRAIVDRGGVCAQFSLRLPILYHTYTIRTVLLYHYMEGIEPGLLLAELYNPDVGNESSGRVEEPAFWYGNFRPVVPRETDISVFEDALRRVSGRAPERVR